MTFSTVQLSVNHAADSAVDDFFDMAPGQGASDAVSVCRQATRGNRACPEPFRAIQGLLYAVRSSRITKNIGHADIIAMGWYTFTSGHTSMKLHTPTDHPVGAAVGGSRGLVTLWIAHLCSWPASHGGHVADALLVA